MKKNKLKKYIWWLIPVVITIFLIIRYSNQSQNLKEVQKIPSLGNQHIQSITEDHLAYNSNPPTSGPHLGSHAPWGVSKEIVPDELQVHNLEDGGVVIQYNPEKVSLEDINKLENTTKLHGRILVAPRYNMEYTIALTAWTRLLPLETVEEEKIASFVNKYAGIDHHAK